MKKVIYVLIIGLLLAGCRSKQMAPISNDAEIIDIPKEITESILNITENYRYITLNVGDNIDAALGGINKLRIFRDKLYVMDNVFVNKLLIFDKSGTFLKKVSCLGRGPMEYLELSTFELDYGKGEIVLKDDASGKILFFDLNGNYKRIGADQQIRGGGISILPNNDIIYGIEGYRTNETYCKLVICNSENKVLQQYCEDKIQYPFGFMSCNFMNPGFDGTVTFAPQFMNEVYRISEQGVKQIYSINFTDILDRKELSKYDAMTFNQSPLSNKTIFIGNHADSEDYFHFAYEYKKESYNVYFNKKNKSAFISNDRLCAKNLTFDEHGNLWGGIMEASIWQDESPKAVEIRTSIMESGNPVVVCYSLKE